MTKPKVSVIMPAYNAERFIQESINSVLNQTLENWELLIIDDGSTDETCNLVGGYSDSRIKLLRSDHGGVCKARNRGLQLCVGTYLCFLDADDVLTNNSLLCRAKMLDHNSELEFVDGKISIMDKGFENKVGEFLPSYQGNPLCELLRFRSSCFFGPSWMIRINETKTYAFNENITHAEDLLFYLTICDSKSYYSYTNETILKYRKHPGSAMSNIQGMENGLLYFQEQAMTHPDATWVSKVELKYRVYRAIVGTYYHSNMKALAARKSLQIMFK